MAEQELDRRVAGGPSRAARSAPPISCYIRTLNEERRIRDVVRAAFQVAEEVVLINSGSTDATLAIAEAEGARVIGQPWLGNGRQKRVGEEAARHDWVLDIDADEVVTPELAAEIRDVFAAGPQFQMYELTLITVPPFGAPWRNFKKAHRVKLYNKRHIRIPDHAAWDQFELPPGEKLGTLRQPIMHYAFAGMEHVITKLNSRQFGPCARSQAEAALECDFADRFRLARVFFERIFRQWPHSRRHLWVRLCLCSCVRALAARRQNV